MMATLNLQRTSLHVEATCKSKPNSRLTPKPMMRLKCSPTCTTTTIPFACATPPSSSFLGETVSTRSPECRRWEAGERFLGHAGSCQVLWHTGAGIVGALGNYPSFGSIFLIQLRYHMAYSHISNGPQSDVGCYCGSCIGGLLAALKGLSVGSSRILPSR